MNSVDPGIESKLIDLNSVSLDRLRDLNSSPLHQAVRRALERTQQLRGVRRSTESTQGERID